MRHTKATGRASLWDVAGFVGMTPETIFRVCMDITAQTFKRWSQTYDFRAIAVP